MRLTIAGLIVVVLLGIKCAWAITYSEIPMDVRQNLPEFILLTIDPQALAALSADDLREFAHAYQRGGLRFVNEIRVVESTGPIPPETAVLILQIPQGAPYLEERFVRIAKWAYGNGIFSRLEWEAHENADGSVDIHLWYASRDSSYWAPELSYNNLSGWMLGAYYEDLQYKGESKRLKYGFSANEKYGEEMRLYGTYTDNTLNRGYNSYFVSASVASEFRERLKATVNQENIRQRNARLDAGYSWNGIKLGKMRGSITAGTGFYDQDHFIFAATTQPDPDRPRRDFDQDGSAMYLSLSYSAAKRDMNFTTKNGYSFNFRNEQHFGDFDFARTKVDYRRYIPMDNILGMDEQKTQDGHHMNIRRFFPVASFGVQLQADITDGDVPFSQESKIGNANIIRSIPYDKYNGTKLIGARAEYRFNLTEDGQYEAFIFTDHAAIGEDLSDLESFNTYGVGTLFVLPLYGGIKLGGYYGGSFDREDSGWGLTFGYQF